MRSFVYVESPLEINYILGEKETPGSTPQPALRPQTQEYSAEYSRLISTLGNELYENRDGVLSGSYVPSFYGGGLTPFYPNEGYQGDLTGLPNILYMESFDFKETNFKKAVSEYRTKLNGAKRAITVFKQN